MSCCSVKTEVDVGFRGFRYRLTQMSAWFSLLLTFTRDSQGGIHSPPATSSPSCCICSFAAMLCFTFLDLGNVLFQKVLLIVKAALVVPALPHVSLTYSHPPASLTSLPLLQFALLHLFYYTQFSVHFMARVSTLHQLPWCNLAASRYATSLLIPRKSRLV